MTSTDPVESQELILYMEGEVTASRAHEIEAQLAWCEVSRQRLAEIQAVVDAVAAVDEDLALVDLVPDLHRQLDAEAAPAPVQRLQPRWQWGAAAAGITALAAALALWLWPTEEIRQKVASPSGTPERWAGIQAWRLPADGKPVSVATRIKQNDALLFSYTNIGPEPFMHLMIMAIDNSGEVFWYYPAYTDPNSDPLSVPLQSGQVRVELPEQIRHGLKPGPLTVYGLFTREPLRVSQVEDEVERLYNQHGTLSNKRARMSFDRSAQHILQFQVTP